MKFCSVQISELRRRVKQLEEENDALSQQNAKGALSVDTLGNGRFSERSEVRTRVLKMTLLWLVIKYNFKFVIMV